MAHSTAQWARAFSTIGGSSLNIEFGLSGGKKKYFKFEPGHSVEITTRHLKKTHGPCQYTAM